MKIVVDTNVVISGIFFGGNPRKIVEAVAAGSIDELIIECSPDVDLNVICKQMSRSPEWMPDILLRADGYETNFYKKD